MILVIGASGFMGRETVKQLLAAGFPVRAVSRTPDKIADLQKLGAEVCPADLIDPPSLARALQGVEKVVDASNSMLGSGKYLARYVDGAGKRALIDAAKAAGVQHYVFTSILGASPNHPAQFFRIKHETEQYLTKGQMYYTILRPPAFMEWHIDNFLGKPLLETGKASILGKGENRTNFISAADVARFAVIALTHPRVCDRVLEIGGPDNLTKNEVARRIGKAAGIEPKISHLPPFMLQVMGAVLGVVKPEVGDLMRTACWADTTDQTFNPTHLLAEFQVELTSVDAFIQRMVQEYKK